MEVLSLGYPFGKELADGSGEIINIDGYEFEHNIHILKKVHQDHQLFYLIY